MTNKIKDKIAQKIDDTPKIEKEIRSFLGPILFKSLGFEKLTRLYREVRSDDSSKDNFIETMLRHMSVNVKVSDKSLEAIPKSGPCVVIANHPFGGIEGIVLVQLLKEIRPDIKVLANFILGKIPEMKDFFLCVDPFGTKDAKKKNVTPIRETLSWLKKDGLLAAFPSGEVSHFNFRNRQVTDPTWSKNIAGIIRRTNAYAVPIYFHGHNGIMFQLLGLIHPRLRTLMLGRELYNKMHCDIELEIGNPIAPSRLKKFSSDEDISSYLRLRTFILRYRANAPWVKNTERKKWTLDKKEPIIKKIKKSSILSEISNLKENNILVTNDKNTVYFATADIIPNTLEEIGRLREITFREVNEGTGKSLDLDSFDKSYIHLFSWNKQKEQIEGAYRLGQTDKIIKEQGLEGLYTHTLFHYSLKLMEQMGPSLEVGRSFVTKEAQKNFYSLFLLWKGICHYVYKNPKYKNLFGPVSISSEYDTISRHLIMSYFKKYNYIEELAKLVKPRNNPAHTTIQGIDPNILTTVVKDINDVSELISEIELKEKKVPILLKQYLKMGGKMLGFNLDPLFGDVLDGLILVDLTESEPKMLKKYFGKENAKSFLAYHNKTLKD